VTIDDVLAEALAEEHLRLARFEWMLDEADHVEVQLRERAAHLVEPVLGLDDDLVEAVGEGPDLLFFGQRPEVSLSAPVLAGAANPLIQDPPIIELHHILERGDEIGQLRIVFARTQLMRDLERHRHHHAGIVGQRGLGHQNLMIAIGQPLDHFVGRLFSGKIEKELLDVLDLERSLLEAVLLDEVFHGTYYYTSFSASGVRGRARPARQSGSGADMLPADLQRILDDVNDTDRVAERLAASCTDEQFHWRPRGGTGWSIAECLDHLATINAFYVKAIQPGVDRARTRGWARQGPLKPGFFGALFINSLEPPVKRRLRAPRGMQPRAAKGRDEILADYRAAHDAVRRLIMDAAEIDANRARYRNPFLKVLNFRVSTGLGVIAAHDRRHLWQAEQVRQAAGYPPANHTLTR